MGLLPSELAAFVLFSGSQTTADVAFLLVQIQDLPYLGIQCRIGSAQPLLQILVDRRFGYAEVLCGGADRGAGFDHVHSQPAGSLFNGICHGIPSVAVLLTDYAAGQGYMSS